MKLKDRTASEQDFLAQWYRGARLRRLLMPQNFLDLTREVKTEDMVCRKATVERLTMKDEAETRYVRTRSARSYSTDLDYRPTEFKKEAREIEVDSRVVGCPSCAAIGTTTCEKCGGNQQVTCDRCKGKGNVDCNKTMNCPRCEGISNRPRPCRTCDGQGSIKEEVDHPYLDFITKECPECKGTKSQHYHCEFCNDGKVTCNRCGGSGSRVCDRCKGNRILKCDKCDGLGKVTCKLCRGDRTVTRQDIIRRSFTPSKETKHELDGMGSDRFKNGLTAQSFASLPGDRLSHEFQTPTNPDVLQRQTVVQYDVHSRHYQYQERDFCLSRVSCAGGSRFVPSGVPYSPVRVAVAVGAVFVVPAVLLALWILL